jgi:hypothetical protein
VPELVSSIDLPERCGAANLYGRFENSMILHAHIQRLGGFGKYSFQCCCQYSMYFRCHLKALLVKAYGFIASLRVSEPLQNPARPQLVHHFSSEELAVCDRGGSP